MESLVNCMKDVYLKESQPVITLRALEMCRAFPVLKQGGGFVGLKTLDPKGLSLKS